MVKLLRLRMRFITSLHYFRTCGSNITILGFVIKESEFGLQKDKDGDDSEYRDTDYKQFLVVSFVNSYTSQLLMAVLSTIRLSN